MPKLKLKPKTNLTKAKTIAPAKAQAKSKPASRSLNVFNKHKPIDNVCLAGVRIQTKKAARDMLEKDASSELFIRSFKEGGTAREAIFKRCRKTKKDGQEFCWKHYETITNRKHPVVHFQKDIVEQLGKTVRKAVASDSYLKTGSVSSRKVEEAKIVASQPIFTMNVDHKMLEELKRIHDQISVLLEKGSVVSSDDSLASESDEETATETVASNTKIKTDGGTDEETSEEETSEEEDTSEVDIVYSNSGDKYYYDEINNRIIDMESNIIGELYQIDCEEAPFCINDKRYIIKQKTKVGGKSHIRCKISNLIFDMTHKLIGSLIIDDGKMKIRRV